MTKAASTSIESELSNFFNISISGEHIVKHINFRNYESKVLPMLSNFVSTERIETMCIIREPVSWVRSWYKYRSRESILQTGKKNNYCGHLTFEQFVLEYMKPSKRESFANLNTQWDFVKDKNNELGINHLFKYDELDTFKNFVEKRIGKSLTIPSLNVSPNVDSDLSAETSKKLKRYLAKDIELYEGIK
tara:strand:+ start:1210 stop:1779 length:570 start_codon:yes stop_codon:yes gene_type:complete